MQFTPCVAGWLVVALCDGLPPSPHFSQGKLLFGEGEEDRRKTMRIVAPKALIAIWL